MGRRWLGRALLAVVLTTASHATATVAPPEVTWANPGPMPANGVILISAGVDAADLDIVVTRDGKTIEGSKEGSWVVAFRAAERLEVGTHQVRVARHGKDELEFALEVVAASAPAAHDVSLRLSVGRGYEPGGEHICCEPDPGSRSLGEGCFYTELIGYRTLGWTATSPLPLADAQQYLYRVSDAPQGVELITNYAPFDEFRRGPRGFARTSQQADEYCLTVEAKSLIDDSVFTTKTCVDDPELPLDTMLRTNFTGAFNAANCPLPPAGFELVWCDELWGECEREAKNQSTSEAVREQLLDDCQSYYERCTPPPPGAAPAADGGTSHRDASSCSVHRPATTAVTPWMLVLALVLCARAHRRRRR